MQGTLCQRQLATQWVGTANPGGVAAAGAVAEAAATQGVPCLNLPCFTVLEPPPIPLPPHPAQAPSMPKSSPDVFCESCCFGPLW